MHLLNFAAVKYFDLRTVALSHISTLLSIDKAAELDELYVHLRTINRLVERDDGAEMSHGPAEFPSSPARDYRAHNARK